MDLISIIVITGAKVICNAPLCVGTEYKQYRWPKSKKKRIRKKWSKNSKYYKYVEVESAVKMENTIFVGPKTYEKLQSWFKSNNVTN